MLTTKEKEKLKNILFSEEFNITYESSDYEEPIKYHFFNMKSKHFVIYTAKDRDTFALGIKVLYVDKENEIDVSDLFSKEEINEILNNTRRRQDELIRKAKEEKKEREENILRKFIKKFK